MGYVLSALLSYLLLYKYAALFAVIFTAAIAIPWPVNTILLAGGAFASQGFLNIGGAFAVAVVANVLGDLTAYALTRRYGHIVTRWLHIERSPTFVRLEGYIGSHAAWTVLLTRFVGFMGSIVNVLAGLATVPLRTFFTLDLIGNVASIVGPLGVGYLLGNYWEALTSIVGTAGGILFVTVTLILILQVRRRRRNSDH